MFPRIVKPELLDSLPSDDPRAIHSRRDLRLINAWMGNARHLSRAVDNLKAKPRRIVELGAGDGRLLLKLAHRWQTPVELFLLDMQPVVSAETLASYRSLGWTVHIIGTRLQDWLKEPSPTNCDLVLANLFLHHFTNEEIRGIFRDAASITGAFISCDPRRWWPALWSTKLLWLLGCNFVTRNDAHISVRAGFRATELSRLWPGDANFSMEEGAAGYASHLFSARR